MCSGDGGATIPRVIFLGSFSADQCDQTGDNSDFSNVLVSSRAACCRLLAVCSYCVDTGDGAPPSGAGLLGSSSVMLVGLGAFPVLGVGGSVLHPFAGFEFGTGPALQDCLYRA